MCCVTASVADVAVMVVVVFFFFAAAGTREKHSHLFVKYFKSEMEIEVN